MRFRTFIEENSLQRIVGMFGAKTPGVGSTTFGAQAAAGAPTGTPQSGAPAAPAMPETGVDPRLLKVTGATPDQKAKTALTALEKGFKLTPSGSPATSTVQIDKAAVVNAADKAIQSGQVNTNDAEGVRTFADKVDPRDVQNILGANRMQRIQQPMQNAMAAATQAGARMAAQR